ncbi:MAG: hypothetical protein KGZ30_04125 [Anaplasmataceae bacterium]|nr:hypothetical protein [Anaplasmataceae bacterium]
MALDAPISTVDLIALHDIRSNTLLLKNNSMVQVLMVSGTNFSLKPEDEQNIITAAYQRFLNSLGFPIQIIIHSRKVNIEKYLENLRKRQDQETSPLLQSQISEYGQFIESFVKENPIMSKAFFVAVPYYPVGFRLPQEKGQTKTPAFDPKNLLSFFKKKKEVEEKDLPAKTEEKKEVPATEVDQDEEFNKEFEKHLLQMKQRVTHVIQGIESIGLQAKLLDDEELIELFYNFYNPETVERRDLNIPKE